MNTVYMRNRSKQKMSAALCSPFNVRAIKMSYRLSNDEKEVNYWLLTTKETAS